MPQVRSVGQLIAHDVVSELLTAPLWWYGVGLVRATRFCVRFTVRGWNTVALGVWLRNLFVPMYGQRDALGRIISFFVRLVQIVFRSIGMLFYLVVAASLLLAYVLVPIAAVFECIRQLTGFSFGLL